MHRPLAYRPEIDGLRAFAVISVLIYHLNHAWLAGGYLGVDIFFVISGFLITSIILKDCIAGEFSFREFYLRRARRILPAMLTVTAISGAAAYLILFPDELLAAAKACKSALLCYSNYHFARQSGYFDPVAENNPFLHTWSLGVEEQFYFIFPLVVVLAYRRQWLKARYLGLLVASGLAVSCYMTFRHHTRAFFALESRAWELAAGAWLAVAASRGTLPRWLTRRAVAPVAVILLLGSVLLLRGRGWTPAPLAMIAVLGAVMFIGSRAGGDGAWPHRVFASPPLRLVGRISYSIYLVHWPLIVFARACYGEPTPALAVVLAGASILLALVLHHLVELPLRQWRPPVVFLTGLAATIAVLVGSAVYGIYRKGDVNPRMLVALGAVLPESQEPRIEKTCPYRIGRTDVEPSMGLWGDSHARMLIPALDAALQQRGLCCEVWAVPRNLPVMGVTVRSRNRHINANAIAALTRPAIRSVIMASRWSSYLMDPQENSNYFTQFLGTAAPADALVILRDGLDKTLARLSGPGRKIVLVYPVPETGIQVPYWMARKWLAGESFGDLALESPARNYPARHHLVLPMLDEMCRKYALLPVYPDHIMIRNGQLQVGRDQRSLYRDDNHVSRLGSVPLVEEILAQLTR